MKFKMNWVSYILFASSGNLRPKVSNSHLKDRDSGVPSMFLK